MYNLQLQKLRVNAGYKTQPSFAKELGIKSRKYETWERGEVKLPLEDACNIADLLGCTLDELAGREVPKEWTDERQAKLNKAFATMDEDGKDFMVASVEGMAEAYIKRGQPVKPLA